MAILEQWDQSAVQKDQARALRRSLRLEVHGSSAVGSVSVVVRNISTTGLLLESAIDLPVGEIVFLDLPQAGATRAKVIWASDDFFGCQFHTPISTATLSAAQLQSPMRPDASIAAPSDSSESFGQRLHRLRKERRLTLSQIAGALGVSKPTVWAWENGKARPVESRMGALASLLEVAAEEIAIGRSSDNLQEVVAASRERIARTMGIATEKVHVFIEP